MHKVLREERGAEGLTEEVNPARSWLGVHPGEEGVGAVTGEAVCPSSWRQSRMWLNQSADGRNTGWELVGKNNIGKQSQIPWALTLC